MGFFKRLLHYYRKIQIHIVTIFFVLIGASSLIIICFNYSRSYEGIHALSDEVIEEVSQDLTNKIGSVKSRTETIAEVMRGAISYEEDFAQNLPLLIPFLTNTLRSSPTIFSTGIATTNGYYVSVIDLAISQLSHYYANPEKVLPAGCKYAIRVIDNNSTPPVEKWEYWGTEDNLVTSETIVPASYNPQESSWFTEMQGWPSTQWANAFLPRGLNKYHSLEEPGITFSTPLFDANKKFYGVLGLNITLNYLSNYITHQQIGQSGKVFVLNDQGQLLIPTSNNLDPSLVDLAKDLLPSAYKHYTTSQEGHFFLTKGSTEYIMYVQEFPISLENDWLIVIAVPFNDFFGSIIKTQNDTIVISLAILVLFSVLIYFFSRRISIPIIQLADEVDKIKHFDFQEKAHVRSKIHEINVLDTSIASMRSALKSFGRYVPKEIVRGLIEQDQAIALGGKKIFLPVMFSDITNFTTTSEALTSEEIMSSLSLYFDAISKVILESQGTIDKYIGDSVMAFWGAPKPIQDPVRTACLAALRADRVCNIEAKSKGLPDWKTRFGIHVGEVIVGNIGTEERMNYTIIGDVVNTASRLTGINKEYHTSIIISEAVQKSIGDEFVTRPLDFVAVKGKKIKLTIYELIGTKEGEFAPSDERKELCKAFTEAYTALQNGRREEGIALLKALSDRFPGDVPTKLLLERGLSNSV